MRNDSDKYRGNKKAHFVFNIYIYTHIYIYIFFENRAVYESMCEKYCIAVQTTDDNTAHAHCMLGT
jgi:hypothetical protein